MENVLNYEAAQCYQGELARQRDRLQMVLDVTNAMVANLDLRELFRTVSELLRRLIRHEYASLVLVDPAKGQLRLEGLDFPAAIARYTRFVWARPKIRPPRKPCDGASPCYGIARMPSTTPPRS